MMNRILAIIVKASISKDKDRFSIGIDEFNIERSKLKKVLNEIRRLNLMKLYMKNEKVYINIDK